MTPYALAVSSLLFAVVVQSIAASLFIQQALRPPCRHPALVLASGLALLALHHALSLELALHTGLFDLRQSLIAAGISLLLLLGLAGIRRPGAGKLPSR